jgi:hypothetical protein
MGICFLGTGSGKPNFAHKMNALFGCNIESTVFSPTEAVQSAKALCTYDALCLFNINICGNMSLTVLDW